MLFSTLQTKIGNIAPSLTGRWFLQIVDRDSGNQNPIYPLFSYSDFLSQMWGWFGGGGGVFLHFMLFPTFLEKIILGIKKTIFFHLMFSLWFFMLDLFPTFLDFFWKY